MPTEKHQLRRPSIRLLEITALRAHERIIPSRVRMIKADLEKTGKMKTPLWVEKDHLVVLNGHHRLAALKELGCRLVPAFLLDYDAVEVGVCPGSRIISIDKQSVIAAGLSQSLFPPRSSLHTLHLKIPVTATPLAALRNSGF